MSVNKYDASQDLLSIVAGGGSEGSFHRTTPVTALTGATTVTITDSKIHATSLIFPFADNGTDEPLPPPSSVVLTEGQCVLTFDALETDTDFTLVILADSINEDYYLNDLTDVDISNPSDGQVPRYNATTQKWENTSLDLPVWTSTVTALTGATSATVSNANIHTTSTIDCYSNVQGMSEPEMTITEGQCVLAFSALSQDTTFKLHIWN